MHKEKRDFTRNTMGAKAILLHKNQYIEGILENYSLKGVFVAAVLPVEINDMVALTIGNTPISAKAKVVRVTDKGVGLQFEIDFLDGEYPQCRP
jgi:hypothetical protein